MDRGEFLSLLRESLEGLIPLDEVEKNIDFYKEYFDESGRPDSEVTQELGDPRLIARTIIEAYKASKGPMADYYTEQARSEYSRGYSGQYGSGEEAEETSGQYGRSPKWYERAAFWGSLILVLSVILVIAFAVVGVFVAYILPVLLLILLIKFLSDHFRKK